jgi:hypothetical protein
LSKKSWAVGGPPAIFLSLVREALAVALDQRSETPPAPGPPVRTATM